MNAGSPFLGLSAVFTGFMFIWSGTCVSAIASFLGDDDFGIDSFLLSTSTYNFVIPHSLNINFFKNEKAGKENRKSKNKIHAIVSVNGDLLLLLTVEEHFFLALRRLTSQEFCKPLRENRRKPRLDFFLRSPVHHHNR